MRCTTRPWPSIEHWWEQRSSGFCLMITFLPGDHGLRRGLHSPAATRLELQRSEKRQHSFLIRGLQFKEALAHGFGFA